MKTLEPKEYQVRKEKIPPFEVRITTYRLENQYVCTVDNCDPGAVLCRTKARNREEAEQNALAKAKKLLGRTRIMGSI